MPIFRQEGGRHMSRNRLSAAIAFALAIAFPTPALAQGSVRITAPVEGATLDATAENMLDYEVDPGPKGNHIHVYADNKELTMLRQLKGSYPLISLTPGSHTLCVKVVNKAHTPTGLEQCVRVTVK
jgi:hypothetical protein